MNKKLAILGGGESGVGAALLAKKLGMEVFVSDMGRIAPKRKQLLDENGISYEEGNHTAERILNTDEIVKSPGIPETANMVVEAKARKIPVIDELAFAARHTKGKLIGITGTNGKTTTTSLCYHILKKAGLSVGLGGNIGKSMALQLANSEDYDYWVLEVSSFQLDTMQGVRFHIAIILNITEDHLDRYKTMENYIFSKLSIAKAQTAEDHLVLWAEDEHIRTHLATVHPKAQLHFFSLKKPQINGAYLHNETITININKEELTMSIHDLAIQGRHNANNTMASGITARILEIRKELIRDCMSDFQNVPHRLENVNTISGVDYINDSKATNINSTWYALESMTRPTIWIVGGVDKGNDYSQLMNLVKSKVKAIIALGKNNERIQEAFGNLELPYYETQSMRDAVGLAYSLGVKGDAVLLSPACASFDLFENYEDRGNQFKEVVRAL